FILARPAPLGQVSRRNAAPDAAHRWGSFCAALNFMACNDAKRAPSDRSDQSVRSSHSSMKTTDFLIVGGGIIGLSIARDLKRRFPKASVSLVEKEPECGLH